MTISSKRLAALRAETAPHNDGRPTVASFEAMDVQLEAVSTELLERLGDVLLWRIVLEPYLPPSRGMIHRPPQVDDAERILSKVGRVVLMGSQAYKSKTSAGIDLAAEPKTPKLGDYVLHEMYAGMEIHLSTGHQLRILTDTEIVMVIKDPSIIRGYL